MVPVGSVGTVHLFYEWKFLQLTGQEWFSVHGKISITAKIWRCTLNFSLQYHLVINFGARVSIYFIGHRVHRNISFPPILIVEQHNCCDKGSGATQFRMQKNSMNLNISICIINLLLCLIEMFDWNGMFKYVTTNKRPRNHVYPWDHQNLWWIISGKPISVSLAASCSTINFFIQSQAYTAYNEQCNSSVVLLHASLLFCWVNLISIMLLVLGMNDIHLHWRFTFICDWFVSLSLKLQK